MLVRNLFLLLCYFTIVKAVDVTIYTKPFEPFSNGQTGYSIDFLKDVLFTKFGEENLNLSVVNVGNNNAIFEAVNNATASTTSFALGTAGISITVARRNIINFLYPFFQSGFQVLARETSDFSTVAKKVTERIFLTFGLFLLGMFVVIYTVVPIVWTLEFKFSGDDIPIFIDRENYNEMKKEPKWKRIMWDIWIVWQWCTFTMIGTLTGYPNAFGARVIHTSLKILRTMILVLATGAMASILTVSLETTSINSYGDLNGESVCTVRGTTPADFIERNNIGFGIVYTDSVTEMFSAFEKDLCTAVVYDYPALQKALVDWNNRQADVNAAIVGPIFNEESYGIVAKFGNPYEDILDKGIIELVNDHDRVEALQARWFSDIKGVTGKDSITLPTALYVVPSILGFAFFLWAMIWMWKNYDQKDEQYSKKIDDLDDSNYENDLQKHLKEKNTVEKILRGVDWQMDQIIVPQMQRLLRMQYELILKLQGKDVDAIEKGLVPRPRSSTSFKYVLARMDDEEKTRKHDDKDIEMGYMD